MAITELKIAGRLFFQHGIADFQQVGRGVQDEMFAVFLAGAGARVNVGVEFFDRGRPLRTGSPEQQIGLIADIVQHAAAQARGVAAEFAASVRVYVAVFEANAHFAGPVAGVIAFDSEKS